MPKPLPQASILLYRPFAEPHVPMPFAQRTLESRLHSVCIALLRRAKLADEPDTLGPAALSALSVLVFSGPRSNADLARAEGVTAPTMFELVRRLQRAKMVVRTPHPEDARKQLLHATDAARVRLTVARNRRLALLQDGMKGLTRAEREALVDALPALEKLAGSLPEGDVRPRSASYLNTPRRKGGAMKAAYEEHRANRAAPRGGRGRR